MLTTNRVQSHFDPWKLWHQLHGELNPQWGSSPSAVEAPLNLWSQDDAAVVTVALPGRRLEDMQVSVHRDVVTIEVQEFHTETQENAKALRVERSGAAVTRQVRLPFEVDPEQVEATYERGLLRINLKRHASTLPSKITVKAG